jgi:hypothetical protein
MILYHYTALEYLDAIRAEGLKTGDIPLTPSTRANAVWLTSDPNPTGHGLTDGGPLSNKQREVIKRLYGQDPRPDARFPNKRRVRIKVVIPSQDRLLKVWLKWARKRIARDWLDRLTETGGGKKKAESWFIYQGVITPDRFQAVEVLNISDGTYSAVIASAA